MILKSFSERFYHNEYNIKKFEAIVNEKSEAQLKTSKL
jgi:hypothetical protein